MVPLYDIISDDFLLLDASQTVQNSITLLNELLPFAVVILSEYDDEERNFYLWELEKLVGQLRISSPSLKLQDALNLKNITPTPQCLAYQDAELVPNKCIAIEQGHVLGFYDASQPPEAILKRRNNFRSTKSIVDSINTEVWFAEADFPERVTVGQTTSLLIGLVKESTLEKITQLNVISGTTVQVVVKANRGFQLQGSWEATLQIKDDEEMLPIRFTLVATDIGPGIIRIFFFNGGQALGAIMLNPTVVSRESEYLSSSYSTRQKLPTIVSRQPDLSLFILERSANGKCQIDFRLQTDTLRMKPFGHKKLISPDKYFRDLFKDIDRFSMKTKEEQMKTEQRLAAIGTSLFEEVLPKALQEKLLELQKHIKWVQILSDEPWIPWEMLRFTFEEDSIIREGPYFGELFAITRWCADLPNQSKLSLKRFAVIAPTNSYLPCAKDEINYLSSLTHNSRLIDQVSTSSLDIKSLLANENPIYDCWHFVGHGTFDSQRPDNAQILLEDEPLYAWEISGKLRNFGRSHPLVFLNACQTSLEGMSLTGSGGWAKYILKTNAAAFVGTLWSVSDRAAYTFSKTFYAHLLAGIPIGEAARLARAEVRNMNDPSWLAYTVFADPLAKVEE